MKKRVILAMGAVLFLGALALFVMFTSRHAIFADPENAAKQTAVFMLDKRNAGEFSYDREIRKEELAELAGKTSAVYVRDNSVVVCYLAVINVAVRNAVAVVLQISLCLCIEEISICSWISRILILVK